MAKPRKSVLEAINTEGWMMSYADMATILLAMFIVLSTLGKDQTGASLQKGLESWRETRQLFGLPAFFVTANRPNNFGAGGPRYVLEGEGDPLPTAEGGTNKEKPTLPSIDQEVERFQRFLGELDRQFKVDSLPRITGQATVDLYERLNKEPPYLASKHKELLGQIVPLLRRPDYRVLIIAWATMAKESAMSRAAETAKELADEIASGAQLDAEARARLWAVGQTWRYKDYQRPVFSLVIAKNQKRAP
jgi:hypothetical protein